MTYKRTPTDDEIEALAEQFRPLWRAGNAIRPWLRKHAATLVDLVHDEWSWADVAAALDRAGIAYKTGNPWQAEQLRAKIAGTRRPLKRDGLLPAEANIADERIAEINLDPMPVQGFEIPDASITATDAPVHEAEPEFKFAKLGNWSGKRLSPITRVTPKKTPDRMSAGDVDAIIAKFTGRKSS